MNAPHMNAPHMNAPHMNAPQQKLSARRSFLTLSLAIVLLALCAAPTWAEDPGTLKTHVSLLIAKPADGAAPPQGVLVTPGMVIPMPADALKATNLDDEQEVARQLHRVADRLAKTLRLSDVEVRYRLPLSLSVDLGRDLPAPSETSTVSLRIKLLGYNDDSASYRVELRETNAVIADTEINVIRGERAVVGGLDGEDAPYLFLVVEPETAQSPIMVDHNDPSITPPRALEKSAPSYTQEARDAKVQGIVVLQAVISETGTVDDVKVLKGLEYGLSEEAVTAIRKWRFEPALKDGQPIKVFYNLTINFRLPKEELEEEKYEG